MRKQWLWWMAAGALCAPALGLGLRWQEGRTAHARLTEGLAVLEAPLERAAALETVEIARAQALFETARRAPGPEATGRRARALWHVAQAWADLARGELSLAQQEADTAEGLQPGEAHVALARATVAARRGDRVRAEATLAALASGRGGAVPAALAARAALLRVELLLDGGRAHEALGAVEALDREHPTVAAVKNLLGLARAAVGDRAGARAAFTAATELAPQAESPRVNLARLAREEGDLPAARQQLERALAVAPEGAEAWLAYGIVLAELRAPEARAALVRAGALAPDAAAPYVAQGSLDLAEGQLAAAAESFRQALAREPEHATARTNLGIALARQGELAAAAEAFEAATRQAPQQGEAWNGLGAMRLALGDAAGALGPLQQATVLLGEDPHPALNLGRALERLQRWDDAARAFREALRRAPDHAAALRHLRQLQTPAAAPARVGRLAAR